MTAVDLDTGRTWTIHRPGFYEGKRWLNRVVVRHERIIVGITDILLEIAADLDAREGRWRVRTISSPTLILGDLRKRTRRSPDPEADLLGRIDRLDLLERPPRSRPKLQLDARRRRRREQGRGQ